MRYTMRHYGITVRRERGQDELLVGHLQWEEAHSMLVKLATAFGEDNDVEALMEDEPGSTSSVEVVGADEDDSYTVTFSLVETC